MNLQDTPDRRSHDMSLQDTTDSEGQHVEIDDGYRFAMIPEAMLYSSISGTAIKVYGALQRGTVLQMLGILCHLSDAEVDSALAELTAEGLIR